MGAPSEHSKLPPSKAYCWTRCSASIGFIEANRSILSFSSSPEADEGTRAHTLLTNILKDVAFPKADSLIMAQIITDLVKHIKSLMRPGDRLLVDQRVPLYYLPSQKGTLDVAIVGYDRIIILDLKYGAGVGVYAKENEQLTIYAESEIRVLEQIELFAPTTPVHLIIWQPRDRNDSNPLREWVITRGELSEHAEKIAKQATNILKGENLIFCPGVACKFCPATPICKPYATRGLTALTVIDDTPVDAVIAAPRQHIVDVAAIPREKRQVILDHKSDLIAFLEAVENQEIFELSHGAPRLQFKLVEGKSNRQWKEEKQAATYLAKKGVTIDAIYPPIPPEMVSPAQSEKALRAAGVSITEDVKRELSAFITKPPGKPTLARIDDKRPALDFNPTEGMTPVLEAADMI
jgi:hypothetical protein